MMKATLTNMAGIKMFDGHVVFELQHGAAKNKMNTLGKQRIPVSFVFRHTFTRNL